MCWYCALDCPEKERLGMRLEQSSVGCHCDVMVSIETGEGGSVDEVLSEGETATDVLPGG